MLAYIPIVLAVLLSFQVFPAALGIPGKETPGKSILPVIILALTQVIMFLAGYYLGDKFMHLLRNHAAMVMFAGFFIIGIRMMMEVLKIRKGQRTYETEGEKSALLVAVAQSVNTFLAGLLLVFLPVDMIIVLAVLLVASLALAAAGAFTGITKTSLAFASLLYLIAGILIIVSSVYFIFAPLV
jgi:putative Mn2+ efflux pump MntP